MPCNVDHLPTRWEWKIALSHPFLEPLTFWKLKSEHMTALEPTGNTPLGLWLSSKFGQTVKDAFADPHPDTSSPTSASYQRQVPKLTFCLWQGSCSSWLRLTAHYALKGYEEMELLPRCCLLMPFKWASILNPRWAGSPLNPWHKDHVEYVKMVTWPQKTTMAPLLWHKTVTKKSWLMLASLFPSWWRIYQSRNKV